MHKLLYHSSLTVSFNSGVYFISLVIFFLQNRINGLSFRLSTVG